MNIPIKIRKPWQRHHLLVAIAEEKTATGKFIFGNIYQMRYKKASFETCPQWRIHIKKEEEKEEEEENHPTVHRQRVKKENTGA